MDAFSHDLETANWATDGVIESCQLGLAKFFPVTLVIETPAGRMLFESQGGSVAFAVCSDDIELVVIFFRVIQICFCGDNACVWIDVKVFGVTAR